MPPSLNYLSIQIDLLIVPWTFWAPVVETLIFSFLSAIIIDGDQDIREAMHTTVRANDSASIPNL